jgi:hypothetical protein
MSHANISDSDSDSDSNSDNDEDINLDDYIKNTNKNLQKVYQIQHTADNRFKLEFMGLFETKPTVSLGDFKLNDNTHCYLSSNFITEEDIKKTNFLPMITLMISKNDKFMNVCMGIEFDNTDINVDEENYGTVFIAFIDENKNIGEILKKKLIYPGSSKLIYFLVGELKNEKIRKYIEDTT